MNPFSRRKFLTGAGGALVGLPLLESLIGEKAAFAQAGGETRHIFVISTNGYPNFGYWEPIVPDVLWQGAGPDVRYVRLSDLPGTSISPVFGPEWNSYRDNINLLIGLDVIPAADGGHDFKIPLTGRMGSERVQGASVDQFIARALPVNRSLVLQATTNIYYQGGATFSYAPDSSGGEPIPVQSMIYPGSVFDSLFSSAGDTRRAEKYAQRMSIIDRVLPSLTGLRNSSRLSSADRRLLDNHAEMLRQLEGRLDAERRLVCASPGGPFEPELTEARAPFLVRNMFDLGAAALKCDLARVLVLVISEETDSWGYDWVPEKTLPGDHHGTLSHAVDDPFAWQQWAVVTRWHLQQVKYLADQLVGLPGTTYIYKMNSMGCQHETVGMEAFVCQLVGAGGQGYYKSGYHVDYTRGVPRETGYGPAAENRPLLGLAYNQWLETILMAAGLSPSQYGGPGFGSYLNNINNQYPENKGTPLPFIVA